MSDLVTNLFNRIFELQIKERTEVEEKEYQELKELEKICFPKEYVESEEDDDGTDWLNPAESVGMTQTIYGWM